MNHVILPTFLMCLILSAAAVIGIASCDLGPPEPECEPPEPSECVYNGQVIWTGPLCAYHCENVPPASGIKDI